MALAHARRRLDDEDALLALPAAFGERRAELFEQARLLRPGQGAVGEVREEVVYVARRTRFRGAAGAAGTTSGMPRARSWAAP
jgi:hypothetical protein